MKKMLFFGLLFLSCLGMSSKSFSATYDATGYWSLYFTEDRETYRVFLSQANDSFSIQFGGGPGAPSFSGSVSGANYSVSGALSEDSGRTLFTWEFTLSSCGFANGTNSWQWTNGRYWRNGVEPITVTREGACNQVILPPINMLLLKN